MCFWYTRTHYHGVLYCSHNAVISCMQAADVLADSWNGHTSEALLFCNNACSQTLNISLIVMHHHHLLAHMSQKQDMDDCCIAAMFRFNPR